MLTNTLFTQASLRVSQMRPFTISLPHFAAPLLHSSPSFAVPIRSLHIPPIKPFVAARRFFSEESANLHDDFKPKAKAKALSFEEVKAIIQKDLASSHVFVYMKGYPDAPMCGFSENMVLILNTMGVPFRSRNVLESDTIRQGIKKYSDWDTIPQLFVKGEFVGGFDIVFQMFKSGELERLFIENDIQFGS